MESFEVKKYLRRPTRIYGDIVVLQEKIENLRLNMLPRAISYDKDRVQTSPQDPMPDFAAKIDELDRLMVKLMGEYYESIGDIQEVIEQIENEDAKLILAKRYVGQKKWDVIMREVPRSRRSLFNYHRIGLRAAEKILAQKQK